MIVGGTGTLGTELIKQYSRGKQHSLFCFSRDELKQHAMKKKFPDVKYIIGDIKDYDSIDQAIAKVKPDIIYHVAALKHVDIIEDNVEEGFKTNVSGLMNCAQSAIRNDVRNFVFSSTDKAVLPINSYGYMKALGEKYLYNLGTNDCKTKFSVFRWGNILGSRGSVIHTFKRDYNEFGKVFITHKNMTRFWLPIEQAVDFMIINYNAPCINLALIPKSLAYPVVGIAEIVSEVTGIPFQYEITGLRKGEKIHECMISDHERCMRSDNSPLWDRAELTRHIRGILK